MGLAVPVPVATTSKQKASSDTKEELLVRLIARRWVKTGAEPDFSWEFWRELHDGQQVWRLFRARPASSWRPLPSGEGLRQRTH